MLFLPLIWIIAGLMVLHQVGMDEVISMVQMESFLAGEKPEDSTPLAFVLTMLLLILFWPIVWLDYQSSRDL